MAGYSQFMEISVSQKPEFAEIVMLRDGFEYSARMVEIVDFGELHGELWCDLMDCNEDEDEDMTGEIRINGKCVAKMRKLGNDVS